MPGSHLFNLGLYQKHFGGNNKILGTSINMGCTKGRGSTTRMFNYCKQNSTNKSECINNFITIKKIIDYVNLDVYFPPVVSQGETDACQCYSMIYHIGSYYMMLIKNNLQFNTLKSYSLNFSDYYKNQDNILNPLYIFQTLMQCTIGPNMYSYSDYYNIAQLGTKNFSNYNLQFDYPCIANKKFEPCTPTINNDKYCNPFSLTDTYNILYQRTTFLQKKYTLSLNGIQNLLQNNVPIVFAVMLNNYFYKTFESMHNPNVQLNYNNSTNPVKINNPKGIWYCADNDDKVITGHVMVLCGYINNVPAAYEADGSTGVFIFRNQYSINFANNGLGYITYNYLFSGLGIDLNGSPTDTFIQQALSQGSSPLDYLYTLPINKLTA
jgi:hypothetical protein